MRLSGMLHSHPRHRARQLRWVVPAVGLLLVTALAALLLQYQVSNQAVSTEFFRAHKTISHTGQLLERGVLLAGAALTLIGVAMAVVGLRVTHRIVHPVHIMHEALDALAAGDLGVRVALHRQDEFHEVGEALNRLVGEFATTLATVHTLVDRVAALSAAPPNPSSVAEVQGLVAELDRTMEFFRLEPRRTISDGD